MDKFLTLQDIGVYLTFITIVTALVQMLKEPIDNLTNRFVKVTIHTSYIVYLVAFVLFLTYMMLVGTSFSGELVFLAICNAAVIGFGSEGLYKKIAEK